MKLDRGLLDRSGIDRPVSIEYTYSILLGISGTGAIENPAMNRTLLIALAGRGSFSTIYPADTPSSVLMLDRGALDRGSRKQNAGLPAVSVDRTIPLAISGTGAIGAPLFDWYFALAFAGTGIITTPLFDWQFAYDFAGTGGFLYTGGEMAHTHVKMLDRGGLDRPNIGTSCINCIPPVLVDRTIPLPISGTGLFGWDFCRLYDLAFSGTGICTTPLFDWQFAYGISGTGQFNAFIDRTFLLDLYGTGVFTSEEWTKTIDLYFGGTGQIADPTVFIPIHYLTAAISGTGHFWDPAVLREITNISALIKGGTVKRSFAEKMFTAQLEFAENASYSPISLNPWQKVTFYQPDYLGNFHPVFVGVFPSSRQTITAASMPSYRAETELLIAYDYAWYLSAQYLSSWIDSDGLPHNEIVLPTPTDQLKQYIHNLTFDTVTHAFKVGDWVYGAASGDYGLVIEINAGGLSNHIRMMYLGPAAGASHYFQNDEQLKVGTTTYAYADGTSTDETGTIIPLYPEDYIKELLGGGSASAYTLGDNWRYTSGIYPYRMNNITAAWTLMPAIEFDFTTTTTKTQAIEKICKYCKSIFYVKWRSDVPGFSGTYMPCAYLVKQSEIDDGGTGLDLPAAAYCSYGGGVSASDLARFMKGTFTADFKGEDQYNWVSVRCQDIYGKWLESHIIPGLTCGSSVYDPVQNPSGTEIKRIYYEENSELATQSDLNDYAEDVYAYYHYQINTWKATFYKRPDLELLQTVIVSGFGPSVISNGTYRIIDIQYDYADAGAKNEVTVTLILDSQFVAYLNLKRVFYNSVYEIENVVNNILGTKNSPLFGVITAGSSTGDVTFSVQINDTLVNYYQGYDPTKSLGAGAKIVAVPDAKGNYICARLV